MILKKCINGSMILIDGISEVQVYKKDGFPWVQIQRSKEITTHRLDEPSFILNDEGKTIERLPYSKSAQPEISINIDGDHLATAIEKSCKGALVKGIQSAVM